MYVRRKIFATEKFHESLPKGGGQKYSRQKYSRRRPDTSGNTLTWLLCCVARRIFDGR